MNDFVYELGLKETQSEKCRKIADLTLHEEEWDRVQLVCNLLGVCIFDSSTPL